MAKIFGFELPWGKKDPIKQESLRINPETTKPTRGGRVSRPEFNESFLDSIMGEGFVIKPEFQVDLIKAVEHLSIYNHDFSLAVDNIVALANTKWHLEFADEVTEEQAEELMKHLSDCIEGWYDHSGGSTALLSDLFAQVTVSGAVSGEGVPKEDLSGIAQVVRVNPKNIRFSYDQDKSKFMAVQEAGAFGLGSRGVQGHLELNPVTYKYIATRRFGESPYAIPPFLSALDSRTIQKDMIESLRFIMKKFGMMGFMEVLANVPDQKQAETDTQYTIRLTDHLKDVAEEASKGLINGLVVGFKGEHEFKHNEVKGDAEGVDKVYALNEQNLMAGLKQPPEMLGRAFSTSETFGRVLLAKFTQQITQYQSAVGSFLKEIGNLELVMSGMARTNVIKKWVFEAPMIGDRVREEEALAKKIENQNNLYNQGVIDQTQRAQALGFKEASEDGPRLSVQDANANTEADKDRDQGATKDVDAVDPKTTAANIAAFEAGDDETRKALIEYYAEELGSSIPELFHGEQCKC